jgi:glycosyltransferase involved in cell wall biosynthesis
MSPLISVVVPFCNAGETLLRTLRSALRQTHSPIEIIAVDDGSTDDSLTLVKAAAREDSRIRVISQTNCGVAAARNTGIGAAQGEFVAPLDADDLWHPEKLERQLRCFEGAGPDVGLVYSWYRRIDEQDLVIAPSPSPVIEGRVLHRHLDWNFISNGSSPLVRTAIAREIGYDPRLREAGNQGCEDYLLQVRVALRYQFRCAPGFLVGYRRSGGAMSGNVARMIRSHIQMYRLLMPDLHDSARHLASEKISALFVELARNRLHRGRLRQAARALRQAWTHAPAAAIRHGLDQVPAVFRQWKASRRSGSTGATEIGRSFDLLDPMECEGLWRPRRRLARLRQLQALDEDAAD